jgi:alpha-galactosidase
LALDTTHPEVLRHLESTFRRLRADGFDYHKIDFCYAAALAGRRCDPRATRAQALRRGLDAVRAGIGDDAFLLACGCPLGPAVGVVDAMRVSCDTASWWRVRARDPGFEEHGSGLANSVQASVLRAPLHRRLWINDADCLLLRPVDTTLTRDQRRLMADVVAGTGGFAVLSDDLGTYGAEEWETVDRLRSDRGDDGPLFLADPFASELTVRSPASELRVDWTGDGSARRTARSG